VNFNFNLEKEGMNMAKTTQKRHVVKKNDNSGHGCVGKRAGESGSAHLLRDSTTPDYS
jgi:hypothetical protein